MPRLLSALRGFTRGHGSQLKPSPKFVGTCHWVVLGSTMPSPLAGGQRTSVVPTFEFWPRSHVWSAAERAHVEAVLTAAEYAAATPQPALCHECMCTRYPIPASLGTAQFLRDTYPDKLNHSVSEVIGRDGPVWTPSEKMAFGSPVQVELIDATRSKALGAAPRVASRRRGAK